MAREGAAPPGLVANLADGVGDVVECPDHGPGECGGRLLAAPDQGSRLLRCFRVGCFDKANGDRGAVSMEEPSVDGGFGLELGLCVGLVQENPGYGLQQLFGTVGDVGGDRLGAGVVVDDGAEGPSVISQCPDEPHIRIVAGPGRGNAKIYHLVDIVRHRMRAAYVSGERLTRFVLLRRYVFHAIRDPRGVCE
jgi:hypothetical protein